MHGNDDTHTKAHITLGSVVFSGLSWIDQNLLSELTIAELWHILGISCLNDLALQHIRIVKNLWLRTTLMHGPLATRGILVDGRQKRKPRRVQNRIRDGKHIGIKGILRVFLLEQPHISLSY